MTQVIKIRIDKKTSKYWGIDSNKEITQTGKVYFRNGENHIPTSQGHYPVIFFDIETIKW